MIPNLRVGGIGTGRVFREGHIPVYAALDGVQLTALYDPDRAAMTQARNSYATLQAQASRSEMNEAIICDSVEALFDQVDAVDICTTVRWHAYYAVLALERGLPVMSEKPMARTWWEAQQVADCAQRSKKIFQLNDDNIFIPRYQALRHVIESGMIGEVQDIWIARGYPGSTRNAWFWQGLEAGGGGIMDYGSHAVAATWFLIGFDKVPVEVRSLGIGVKNRTRFIAGRLQQIEIDDDAHFKIRYSNPHNNDWITVHIEATWTWPDWGRDGSDVRGYIEVEGSEGTVTGFVDDQDRDFLRVKHRALGERLLSVPSIHQEDESFRDEITNFVECVRANSPSIVNAEIGATVIKLINAAQLSELRGRVSVTPTELESFSRDLAADLPDPWQAGDRIATALLAPYRLPT